MASCLAAAACLAATVPTAAAGDFAVPLEVAPVQEDEWKFDLGIYAYMPELNASAANGYDINIGFDLVLDYRYLDWDFGTGGPLTSLDTKGPQLGVRFTSEPGRTAKASSLARKRRRIGS